MDFRGDYIRTASVLGTVTANDVELVGVTVRLSGMADSQSMTDDIGQYRFDGLRSGTYSVEISGFDATEVGFSSTFGEVTLGMGESKVVSFEGTYLRTAVIQVRYHRGRRDRECAIRGHVAGHWKHHHSGSFTR